MSYVMVAAGVIAAIGATATYVNARNTANRQDSQLAQSLRQQGQLQQEANAKSNELIQKTAQSSAQPAQASLLDQFTGELNRKAALANGGLGQAGKVSDAYNQAANDAASGIADYGKTRAGLISAIDAPMLQRQQEGANLQDFATQINQLKDQSSAQQFLTQMKLRGIQPNPYLTAVSGISSGVSSGLASRGFGGGSAGGAVNDGTGSVLFNGSGYTNLPFKTAG
jgi:hypothetical protein